MQDDFNSEHGRVTIKNKGVNPEPDSRPVEDAALPTTPKLPVYTTPQTYLGYSGNQPLPAPPPISRESAARERVRRRYVQQRKQGGEWAWVVIAVALLGFVILGGMSAVLLVSASTSQQEILPTATMPLPTAVVARNAFPGSGEFVGQPFTLEDGRTIELIPWDGVSRYTILMMGLDRRPGETGLAYRTDTMLVVSIDPAAASIGVLSIPRDLYVAVPGYSQRQRVNTPMVLGELQQPGYGPTLAMQTVQYNLGMRVHEYVAVDFQAFVVLVDAVGGIDVDVPYTINDPEYPDMNYGYDPFYITAGLHHLDGITALKYARTRHGDNDYRRAERQQQVLFAIRDRVLNFEMLPQLIFQAPTLLSGLDGQVYTGMSLEQMIQLALYLRDIPADNIRVGVIDERYTSNYFTPDGAAVLIPNQAALGALLVEVFGASYSE